MPQSIELPDDVIEAVKAYFADKQLVDVDLDHFVAESIRARLFFETVRQIKADNADFDQQEILDTVEEAVNWARANRS